MSNHIITQSVQHEINSAVLCWLATIDAEGFPSVSPKQVWGSHDETTLVVSDIASPGSVRNIRNNPSVCVSFLDIFRQKGYKIIGSAHVVSKDEPDFLDYATPLIEMAGERFQIRNVIVVKANTIKPIIAPSYSLYDASEAEMIIDSYQTYGVQKAE